MNAGIRDILIISTPQDILRFEDLLEDGHQFGVNLTYTIQPSLDGLSQAFIISANFIGNEPVALILGDNIFAGHGLKKRLRAAVANAESDNGALYLATMWMTLNALALWNLTKIGKPSASKKKQNFRRATTA